MIAGVAIDKWKLAIFKKHLDEGGFTYTEHNGLTPDTLMLKVTTASVHALTPTILAATNECKRSKLN